jgi:uncharacterized protein YkwD
MNADSLFRSGIALLALAFALAAEPVPAAEPAPQDRVAVDAVPARMVARINLHRARHGVPPLRLDAALSHAASGHARDMADEDFFAHAGANGTTIGARARQAGYAWRRIAENIAAGMAEPEDAVDDWMGSEGHRLNMLEPEYVHAGVGHAFRDPDPGRLRYRHYWTLMLGTPGDP